MFPVSYISTAIRNECSNILRNMVFKYAVPESWILELLGASPQKPLDMNRLNRTQKFFETLGTRFESIAATEATIQVLSLNSQVFNKKIIELGGFWVATTVNRKQVFGIIPPNEESQQWNELCKALQDIFKDFNPPSFDATTDDGQPILITAIKPENAPIESRLKDPTCILFTNQAEPWQLRKKRLAYFLGRGFSVATYNGRGIHGQPGRASIEGSYNDAETAFLYLRKDFRICLYGNCKDSFPAMYIAKKYSTNAIFETPPPSFKQAVKNQNYRSCFCVSQIGLRMLNCLNAPEDSLISNKFPQASLGNLLGIVDSVPAVEQNDFYLIFLENEGDTSSPPEQIDSVADYCHTVLPKAEVIKTLIQTTGKVDANGKPVNPHNVQSWEDPNAIDWIEKLICF